jgi:hypothetical protein
MGIVTGYKLDDRGVEALLSVKVKVSKAIPCNNRPWRPIGL